jgi:hypothetical protein
MAGMKLPRFQFRLRTLMIVVTLLAVACGNVGWQAKFVRARTAMRQRLSDKGAAFIDIFTVQQPGKVAGLAATVAWRQRCTVYLPPRRL